MTIRERDDPEGPIPNVQEKEKKKKIPESAAPQGHETGPDARTNVSPVRVGQAKLTFRSRT